MNIGKAIRLYRIQCNLNQHELAAQAFISVSYLSLLERGKRDPVLSTLEQIAAALNVPLALLVLAASDEGDLEQFPIEVREKVAYLVLKGMQKK